MKIYIGHSSDIDYVNKIYKPIKEDIELSRYDIVFPHEKVDTNNSRKYYDDFDLVICEVSKPSTGLGIEMGFFFDSNIPIYCLYEKGMEYSKSIKVISDVIIEYDGTEDFISKIKNIIGSR